MACPWEQMWSAHPCVFGAPWTESMQLGATLHDEGREAYCKELEGKTVELGRELGLCQLQIHVIREDLEKVRACRRALESQLDSVQGELQEARMELALLRRERDERIQQERLAMEIWSTGLRKEPDVTWDPPPVLLSGQDDPPLTVSRVAADLGFKFSRRELHELGASVREAFLDAHGRFPDLRVFAGQDGRAERVGFFTERDRELIASVVRDYAARKD